MNDKDLLREYVGSGSESAFTGIVHRHVNLVYSVALRFTGNSEDAQDVTQAVFVILGRKAARLRAKTILTGWLYETTRFTAMNFLTHKSRRQAREQEAYMQSTLNDAETESIWRQLAPLLEGAMTRLSERDRTLVALRFFENKSIAETAALAGMNEWAARKRIERTLEKLRAFFSKHGVSSTAAMIAGAISANSVQAAPATLAKSATAIALAKGATASASTLTLIKGTLNVMAWTKAQTAIVAGAILLLAMGTTTITIREIVAHRSQAWRERMDVSVLDRVPRQVKILPALRSRPNDIGGWEEYHGMLLGLNQPVIEIVFAAYNDGSSPSISRARMIFSDPMPEGTYDFISNVAKDQQEALQQEIKKEFSLVGRREWIETNVLILTVRNSNAGGLKHSVSAAEDISRKNGIISVSNFPISDLPILLEDLRPGTPVVDRAGLTGYCDLKWDYKHGPLEKAVLDQLGLELVPGQDRVEFLVMDRTN